MSVLDIIIFSCGGIIVGIYAFIEIRRVVKFKKAFKRYKQGGLTDLQAKEQAMKECYPKKYKKMQKENAIDELFED